MAQESLVIDVKEKLGQDDEGGLWQTSVGPEERVKVAARCEAISDWIDEEVGPATQPKVIQVQDNSILLYQVVPSASKLEAGILTEFELNLDHPGGNEEGNPDQNHQEPESRPSGGEMLNLDHPGGIHFLISLISPPDGLDSDS